MPGIISYVKDIKEIINCNQINQNKNDIETQTNLAEDEEWLKNLLANYE